MTKYLVGGKRTSMTRQEALDCATLIHQQTGTIVAVEEIHTCEQCYKDMGLEWFLGPICGKCTKTNHRKVCRN